MRLCFGPKRRAAFLFSVKVWDELDFTVSMTWGRVETPRPNEDGVVPKPNDFRMAFGLGLEL